MRYQRRRSRLPCIRYESMYVSSREAGKMGTFEGGDRPYGCEERTCLVDFLCIVWVGACAGIELAAS
jgi:hypothetical protein